MNVTYLFDPLCGWCYGASPVLEQIRQLEGVAVESIPTGLFAGEGARPMDSQFATYAWQNDQRIARLTGHPFSETYRRQVLGATDAMFDSAPATLAIVAVGLDDPTTEFAALKAIQHARYVDGQNNSDLDTVADILAAAGFTNAATRIQSPDEALMAAYRAKLQSARKTMAQFEAVGVPTVIVGHGDERRLLPSGVLWGDFNVLVSHLKAS